jgi:hypothetical protein
MLVYSGQLIRGRFCFEKRHIKALRAGAGIFWRHKRTKMQLSNAMTSIRLSSGAVQLFQDLKDFAGGHLRSFSNLVLG